MSGPTNGNAGAVSSPSAPARLPTIELRRRLGVVNDHYLGLNDFVIKLAWATQPSPMAACQLLGDMLDQIENLTDRLAELRRHVELLWDLSYDEGQRRQRA